MLIQTGNLLVSHPAHSDAESVIIVTDSGREHTIGIELAVRSEITMAELMQQKSVEWPWHTPVYPGGESNRGALVMLHSLDWTSSNTNFISPELAISSDALMLEKLEMGNAPAWHRLFLGCTVFRTKDLREELARNRSRWLLLSTPSFATLERDSKNIWKSCLNELSSRATQQYLA